MQYEIVSDKKSTKSITFKDVRWGQAFTTHVHGGLFIKVRGNSDDTVGTGVCIDTNTIAYFEPTEPILDVYGVRIQLALNQTRSAK